MPAYTTEQLVQYATKNNRIYCVHAYTIEGRRKHSFHRIFQDPFGHFYFEGHGMCGMREMIAHYHLAKADRDGLFADACFLFAMCITGENPLGMVFERSHRSRNNYTQEQLAWWDEAAYDLLNNNKEIRQSRNQRRFVQMHTLHHNLPMGRSPRRVDEIISNETNRWSEKRARVQQNALRLYYGEGRIVAIPHVSVIEEQGWVTK